MENSLKCSGNNENFDLDVSKLDVENIKICSTLLEVFSSKVFLKCFLLILDYTKSKNYPSSYYCSIVSQYLNNKHISQDKIAELKVLFNNPEFEKYSKRLIDKLEFRGEALSYENFEKLFNIIKYDILTQGLYDFIQENKNKQLDYKNELYLKLCENGLEDFEYLEDLVDQSEGEISRENLFNYTVIKNGVIKGIFWQSKLSFTGTSIKHLKKFVYIFHLDITDSQIQDLGEIEKVDFLYMNGSILTSLGNLKVASVIEAKGSKLESLGNLIEVDELYLQYSSIKDLGLVEKFKKLDISNTNIKSLGLVQECTHLIANNSLLQDLGNLIGVDYLIAKSTKINSLGNLTKALEINLDGSPIVDLGKLKYANTIYLGNNALKDLGNFQGGVIICKISLKLILSHILKCLKLYKISLISYEVFNSGK